MYFVNLLKNSKTQAAALFPKSLWMDKWHKYNILKHVCMIF